MATSNTSRNTPDCRGGPGGPPRDTRTQLFVGNLPYRVRWQDLKDLFRKAGTVLRADVSLGPDNRSRGYGTVLLATAEDAGRAVDMYNGYDWQTRVLEVRPDRLPAGNREYAGTCRPGTSGNHGGLGSVLASNRDIMNSGGFAMGLGGNPPNRTLFVGNVKRSVVLWMLILPFHVQWQDLKDLFRLSGPVLRADVALAADGRSRGFGTVVFRTEEEAERARRSFDGWVTHNDIRT
ncbi:RNA-binding domain-containing protein [Pleurotus eryngii]|uniref:RNA-binding domain-containing protein n=1 Tax=Pleurotus eryngii TaxID=5323 RepID=A0A9P6DJP0_PLEER|nr:RNA-binding domain-containing protein [Pleurotus eryngii]